MNDKQNTQKVTGKQLRTEYAMAIYDWCRAYPHGTLDDLLDLISVCESRVVEKFSNHKNQNRGL